MKQAGVVTSKVVGAIPGGKMTKAQKAKLAADIKAAAIPVAKPEKKVKPPKAQQVATKPAAPAVKPEGIGSLAKKLILANRDWTNEKIAATVRDTRGSNTTGSCIAWYKSKMRLKGEL